MRVILRSALILAALAGAATAAAQAPPVAAQQLAERAALLRVDGRCRLLEGPVRTALLASAGQSRADLQRQGWTGPRLSGLEQRAAAAGDALACDDASVRAAAGRARAGYAGWARTPSLSLPGVVAGWEAARRPDGLGFVLWQDLAGAPGARFGLAQGPAGAQVTLRLPVAGPAPATAVLRLRDPARAPAALTAPGRTGLAARAPADGASRAIFANGRTLEPGVVRFTFPAAALRQLAALAPLEAAVIEAGGRRLHLEIGDLPAALAFLAAGG